MARGWKKRTSQRTSLRLTVPGRWTTANGGIIRTLAALLNVSYESFELHQSNTMVSPSFRSFSFPPRPQGGTPAFTPFSRSLSRASRKLKEEVARTVVSLYHRPCRFSSSSCSACFLRSFPSGWFRRFPRGRTRRPRRCLLRLSLCLSRQFL